MSKCIPQYINHWKVLHGGNLPVCRGVIETVKTLVLFSAPQHHIAVYVPGLVMLV